MKVEKMMSEEKENRTIEENFEELENIISRMQSPEATLEESFDLYHKGLNLIKLSNDKIDGIEKKIEILNKESGDE